MAKEQHKPIRHRIPYDMPEITDYSATLKSFTVQTEHLIRRKLFLFGLKKDSRELQSEYLDSIVDAATAQQLSDYDRIYRNDLCRIQEASARMDADRDDLIERSNQIAQEIADLTVQLELLNEIYEKYNPLHHGRLDVNGFAPEDEDAKE